VFKIMPSIYTFTSKAALSEPGELNNFGNLRRDGSRQAEISAANGMQTTDATTPTSQASPLTVTDAAVVKLSAPSSAMMLHIITETNTLNISELSSMSSYVTLPTAQEFQFSCGMQSAFYLESNTGNATVSFWWDIV
jgi:hypothetical protein